MAFCMFLFAHPRCCDCDVTEVASVRNYDVLPLSFGCMTTCHRHNLSMHVDACWFHCVFYSLLYYGCMHAVFWMSSLVYFVYVIFCFCMLSSYFISVVHDVVVKYVGKRRENVVSQLGFSFYPTIHAILLQFQGCAYQNSSWFFLYLSIVFIYSFVCSYPMHAIDCMSAISITIYCFPSSGVYSGPAARLCWGAWLLMNTRCRPFHSLFCGSLFFSTILYMYLPYVK